jgi:hypothetical protein
MQFTYPYASLKDAQATGEAFNLQKGTSRSNTSKHEKSLFFSIFEGHTLHSWIQNKQLKLMRIHADLEPDPDPQPWFKVLGEEVISCEHACLDAVIIRP